MQVIANQADLDRAAQALAAQCPKLRAVIMDYTPLPLRLRAGGFEALLRAIVGQQVSTAAAAAIWRRLEEAELTAEMSVAAATLDQLRDAGLSRPKVRYAKALADAALDYDALTALTDEAVISTLTAIPGIGRWTAEIYAKFSLGRMDVFAAGDLALQEAARHLYDLDDRPSEAEMRTLAADWAPYRAVAARALWAYYRTIKGREGV